MSELTAENSEAEDAEAEGEERTRPTEQLALVLTRPGKLEALALPPPAEPRLEGDLVVRMEYSAIQPLDTQMLSGVQGIRPSPSTVLGSDGVGRVVSSLCERLPAGSRVVFLYRRFGVDCGCWRSEVSLSTGSACVALLPTTLAPQVAAAGLTSSVLALACLRHFSAGALAMVTGAAGAVGLTLVQMALLRGMRVVALLRGSERASWILQEYGALGTLSVVDCDEEGWCELAASLCDGGPEEGGGADILLDGIGGPQVIQAVGLVRPKGSLVIYGAIAGLPDSDLLDEAVKRRSLRLIRESTRSVLEMRDAEVQLERVLDLMAAEKLRPHAWQMVPWRDAMNSLVPQPVWSSHESQLSRGTRIGRILLKF